MKTYRFKEHPPGPVKQDLALLDIWTQQALDDPRPGDIFHEMYSFGVQVVKVTDTHVHWYSFSSKPIAEGEETLEAWKQAFRYGDHMPGKHTMHLLTRGGDRTP